MLIGQSVPEPCTSLAYNVITKSIRLVFTVMGAEELSCFLEEDINSCMPNVTISSHTSLAEFFPYLTCCNTCCCNLRMKIKQQALKPCGGWLRTPSHFRLELRGTSTTPSLLCNTYLKLNIRSFMNTNSTIVSFYSIRQNF